MQSNEEFHKHMAKIRAVMREAQKCVEAGFITKSFVDQYIDKIFVTPEKDGTIRLDIRIFTGEATEKYLEKLKVRSGQINHPTGHPEESSTAATDFGDGVHPGHTSNKSRDLTGKQRQRHRRPLQTSENTQTTLIPQTEALLDSYDHMTNQERNALLKTVLHRIEYEKGEDGKIVIDLYPRLPRL